MENFQTIIENKLGKKVNFNKINDGANLLFTATIAGITVANVYKSFDKNFNQIFLIRYTEADIYPN
jgi:hypothetical protein